MPHFGKRETRVNLSTSPTGCLGIRVRADRSGDGYTPSVERMSQRFAIVFVVGVAICGWTAPIGSADLSLRSSDGSTVVRWSTWLEDHGPAAIVLWASWTPDAEATLNELDGIVKAARSRELNVVLISVQEGLDESRSVLGDRDIAWFNDRYGGLLKELRVVKIPALVIVAQDGRVLARLEATSQALDDWKSE
jgi:thiol-disulfide isomerase/thioredoxin